MDRRLTPSNGRVAHVSLQGKVKAERFTEGELMQVTGHPFLRAEPSGARDRQLLWGDRFRVLETRNGWSFGQSLKDGYVGYVQGGLTAPREVTHRVNQRFTWANLDPDIRAIGAEMFSLNCQVGIASVTDGWAELAPSFGPAGVKVFVPANHLSLVSTTENDPVQVAERLLGTPYVWAGNTGLGIDCSGLVQAALLACGIACPGDSDQQAALGEEVKGDLRRGDLLFWKGHVAMVVDQTRIIHANAHHMQVVYEGIGAAIERIAAQGDGPVTARRRVLDL